MRRRTGPQIGGLILGAVLLAGGAACTVYPTDGVIFHQEYEPNVSHPEYVTAPQMRAYGGAAVALGACLVWFSGRPWGRKRAAVEDYVWRLSQDLSRRFGARKYYTVEQVTRAAEASGATKVYIAFAHAMFCSRQEFDDYYTPLRVACTYDGLREPVSRRYFGNARNFDAATIVRMAREPYKDELAQTFSL